MKTTFKGSVMKWEELTVQEQLEINGMVLEALEGNEDSLNTLWEILSETEIGPNVRLAQRLPVPFGAIAKANQLRATGERFVLGKITF